MGWLEFIAAVVGIIAWPGSASLGWFFCHADQEKRRACDHRQCPADACQGC